LAYGIDSAAHKGALETEGLTAAVVAHGLNMIYPKIHQNLAAEIIKKGGVIISEYDPETPPYQHQFLERNRIIAGLAIATIVVEAPIHSGSLATARYAAEAGREVFVTPGPHYSKNYEGSHDLIRKGARLVASFEHLKEDLAAIADQNQDINLVEELKEEVAELSAQEKLVLDMIVKMNGKATIDSLAEITKLKPQALSSIITTLILTDKIAEVRGNFVIKK
jgi:DNA processing protein